MGNYAITANHRRGRAITRPAGWTRAYLRHAAMLDFVAAALSSTMALEMRFGGDLTAGYAALSAWLPFFWVVALQLSGVYDDRYIGTGSDEFRKVLNAGVSLTAGLAILSYAVNTSCPGSTCWSACRARHGARPDRQVRDAQAAAPTAPPGAVHVHRGGRGARVGGRGANNRTAPGEHHGLNVVAACLPRESASRRSRACRWSANWTTQPPWCAAAARHGGRAVLPGDGRHEAQDARLGTGEDRHRPVRRARAARRGRPADHGPADRRADPAARGPPAAERAAAGGQGPVRPVRRRVAARDRCRR